MIKIYYIDLGWYSDKEFLTINDAIEHAKLKCHSCIFETNESILIGIWSIYKGYEENE
jgi:hypothetical protein